jgi:uncharacterized membrane protein (DUF485 family)
VTTTRGNTDHSIPNADESTDSASGATTDGEASNGAGRQSAANGQLDGVAAGEDALDEDALFEVLSNRRRRFALHYLRQTDDEAVELGDISTQVAAWETGTDPANLGYRDRKAVHTSLYQYHVPKLAEAGIVDYDSQRGVVRPTGENEAFEVYLETVSGRDVPWGVYFLGLSGVLTALAAAAWLEVPPLAALSSVEWGLVVAVPFLVSSIVFAFESRYRMRIGSEGPPPEVREP